MAFITGSTQKFPLLVKLQLTTQMDRKKRNGPIKMENSQATLGGGRMDRNMRNRPTRMERMEKDTKSIRNGAPMVKNGLN